MDALSDVLSTLRLRTSVSSRFEGRGRWALRFAGHESHIKFGTVVEGQAQLQIEGMRAPVVAHAGDFYLLTNSGHFVAASVPPGIVQDGSAAWAAGRDADGVVRLGTSGPLAQIVSGRFTFEGEASRLLLRHLPELVHLRADDPATKPLVSLLGLLRCELSSAQPGADISKASLASLVLVQALRVHLAHAPQPRGWLGAMADARVGAALSAMHADLPRRWTVESLAHEAGMSRTAFAVRFRELVGTSPLDYLTDWRMTVARSLLRHGDSAVATVAGRVGYLSDTAFSAAFKRSTGQSPASFRDGPAEALAA